MSAKLFINARVYSLNCAIDTLKTKEKTNQRLAHLKEKIDNYFLNKCFVFPTAYVIIHWLLGGKIGHIDVFNDWSLASKDTLGTGSRKNGIFKGESLQHGMESPTIISLS